MKFPPFLQRNLWKSTLWFGPGFMTAGLIIGGIQREPSPLALGLVGVGLLLTIWGLALWGGLWHSLLQNRSTQAGTDAVIATLSVLVILGLLNGMAVQYPVRWDFTETRLFTLAPQTQKLLQNLETPIKLWVFEPLMNPIDRELLNSYRRLSEQFSYAYIDPQIDIALADRFEVQTVGEVYLEYNHKKQLIQTLREGETLSEVQITNGIEKILRDRQPQIYFLQGHGELPLEPIEGGLYQAVDGLEQKGYAIWPLDLTETETVPEDATVLIIASPEQALFPGEVDAIATYLAEGGSVLMMIDPETFSGLDPLLEDWGIRLDGRLIIDASGAGVTADLSPATPVVTDYGTHPITLDFKQRISFYPLAQAVVIEEPAAAAAATAANAPALKVVPLVISPEASWAEANVSEDTLEFDPAADLAGPLNIAVAATRSLVAALATDEIDSDAPTEAESAGAAEVPQGEAKSENPEARLVVFGNATFASNGWFEQQLNGDVFLNSVKWLANEDEAILSIRPKSLENRRINLQPAQAAWLTWLAIVVFPLLGFVTAGWLWWRDR